MRKKKQMIKIKEADQPLYDHPLEAVYGDYDSRIKALRARVVPDKGMEKDKVVNVGREPILMKDGSLLFDGETTLRSDSGTFPSKTMYVLQKHTIKKLEEHIAENKTEA